MKRDRTEYFRDYAASHRDERREANRRWYERNRKAETTRAKAYRATVSKEQKRAWRTADPVKYHARAKLHHAIADGKIERQPCACGNPKSHGHHHDYSKPLDVIWMCAACHGREHRIQ